ncbi:MAG: tetratricopeptide repeat protein [Ruminococcus sp.]|nr:tetratricopeptide repeat protein [Ruminococcus sp.]
MELTTGLIGRTKNENDLRDPEKLRNKPKIFFSCHPDDFKDTFNMICDDIFKTHDCVIYCRGDLNSPLPPEIDLGRMTLFVFAVTFKMLRGGNLAADSDLPLAKNAKRPILPIVTEQLVNKATESSFNELYSQQELFGSRQYLNKYSNDSTEISYADKLKKYLDSTLIDDKTAELIRGEFDAYIFLSYRKKDRQYANELMKLIHSEPVCRNLAIWFDEFLTPGEDFNEAILKAVQKSKLFTLLVTKNLLENNNFIMTEEYPAALKFHKSIFPAGKESADYAKLAELYPKLPEIVSAADEELFKNALLDAVKDIVKHREHDDPNHDYLIGLAFLDGIDVEVNVGYGVELLTKAGEAGLAAAMKKLYSMYDNGSYVSVDYEKAIYWAEKLYNLYLSEYGENSRETLEALHRMAVSCRNSGKYRRAAELLEKCYTLGISVFGEKDRETLTALNDLASVYNKLGDYHKALEFCRKNYELCKESTDDPVIIIGALRNLSSAYYFLEDFEKSLELDKLAYEQSLRTLGEKHPETLKAMNSLAASYYKTGNIQKESELFEKTYRLRCEVLGEENPYTLQALNNLAVSYSDRGDERKAFELKIKCYELRCKVLGEEHPDTLMTLNNIAISYSEFGDHKKELEIEEKCYELRCRALGEDHPDTLTTLNNLAITYGETGNRRKEAELDEKCYELRRRRLGEDHPDTLMTLNNLAIVMGQLGDHARQAELYKRCFELRAGRFGESHPDTLKTLKNLYQTYEQLGETEKEIEARERYYRIRSGKLGESHPDIIGELLTIANKYDSIGKREKARELRAKHRSLTGNKKNSFLTKINDIHKVPDMNIDLSNKIK